MLFRISTGEGGSSPRQFSTYDISPAPLHTIFTICFLLIFRMRLVWICMIILKFCSHLVFAPQTENWGAAWETFPRHHKIVGVRNVFSVPSYGAQSVVNRNSYARLCIVFIFYTYLQNTFRLAEKIGCIIVLYYCIHSSDHGNNRTAYRAALYRSVDPPPLS